MQERLQYLFERYITRASTPQEIDELMELVEDPQNKEIVQSILDTVIASAKEDYDLTEQSANDILQAILSVNKEPGRKERNGNAMNAVPIRRMYKWIAAASVIIVASLIFILILSKNDNGGKPTVAQTHDVPAPSNTRAVITLADGSKVYLDSTGNGVLAKQSDVSVVRNNNGEIIYSPDHSITPSPDHQITYNTLYNPRGSKVISLTLSDGTKVWLNSESSLKYPIAFNDRTREVEITGEAYFEVKHNAKQPFKVHLPNGSVVEDIGTSFNINAYSEESDIKTTLIEGAVKVSSRPGALAVNLKPGEQAEITRNSQLITHNSVDLESTVAWKNGRFQFSESSIENILKEISRYYDAEIVYQDKIPGHFVADISRDVPVSKLLHILELTNRVHFKIEGKKITVTK